MHLLLCLGGWEYLFKLATEAFLWEFWGQTFCYNTIPNRSFWFVDDSAQCWRSSHRTRRVVELRWCSQHQDWTGVNLGNVSFLHGSSPSSSGLGGNPTVSLPPAGVMRYNSCPSIPAWPFSSSTASDELVPCAVWINTRPSLLTPLFPPQPVFSVAWKPRWNVCSVGPDAKNIPLCFKAARVGVIHFCRTVTLMCCKPSAGWVIGRY